MSDTSFHLAPSIEVEALAERFARTGRVQIAPFLDEADATALAAQRSPMHSVRGWKR
jgi:hypothetical protein